MVVITSGIRHSVAALADLVAESYRREHTPGLEAGAQDPLQKNREVSADFWQGLAENIRFVDKSIKETMVTLPELQGFQGFLNDFLQVTPQLAVGVAAAVATGGSSVAPALLMGAQAFGQTYGELVAPTDGAAPVDVTTAAVAAAANAVPQAILEKVSLTKFFDIFKASGLGNIAKAAFKSSSTEFITELLQQYPEEISSMLARSYQAGKSAEEAIAEVGDALGEVTARGIYAGGVGALWGLLGGAARGLTENIQLNHRRQGAREALRDFLRKKSATGVNGTGANGTGTSATGTSATGTNGTGTSATQGDIVDEVTATDAGELSAEALADLTKRMDEVIQAAQFKDSLTDISQALDAAHVKAASVEGAKEVVTKAIPEGHRTTWLDAEDVQAALAQGEAPREEANAQTDAASETLHALGLSQERLVEAQRTGEALPVDTAALCSLPASPVREALINSARRSPTSLSAAEAEVVSPAENLPGLVHTLQRGAKSMQGMRAELNRLRKELSTVAGPRAAKQYTALLAAQARTMEARYGLDGTQALSRIHVAGKDRTVQFTRDDSTESRVTAIVDAELEAPAAPLPTSLERGKTARAENTYLSEQADKELTAVQEEARQANSDYENVTAERDAVRAELEAAKQHAEVAVARVEEAERRIEEETSKREAAENRAAVAELRAEEAARAKELTRGERDELRRKYDELEAKALELEQKIVETEVKRSELESWRDQLATQREETAHRLNVTTVTTSQGKWPVHYEIRELSAVIPSHDPTNEFRRNPSYPPEAQERQYHRDKNEQAKVLNHAGELDPDLLLERGATAANGAPIITVDGLVLGGNSRTMSVQYAYDKHMGGAHRYKEQLAARADEFGLDGSSVADMERPILVRVLEQTPEDLPVASRLLNETMTQALDPISEGVSQANRFYSEEGQKVLKLYTDIAADFESLRDFLDSSKSRPFVEGLKRIGILQPEKLSVYMGAKTQRFLNLPIFILGIPHHERIFSRSPTPSFVCLPNHIFI